MSDNERLFEVYEELKKQGRINTYVELAKALNTNKAGINDLKSGKKKVSVDNIRSMKSSYSDINTDYLLTGNGKALKKETTDVSTTSHTNGIPLIPVEAFAGIGYNTDHNITLETIEDRYIVPLFEGKEIDFLIYVRGTSMQPRYSSGDVVGCKLIEERLFIQWNKIYVIYTKSQGVLIKRLRKSTIENYITCRSDNTDYEDFDVPLDDIQNIALVIGSIRLE